MNASVGFCGDVCGWDVGDSFTCPWCERTVCYCQGANDDAPALCNDCAMRVFDEEEPMSGYQIVDGVEIAPENECIVCGLKRPAGVKRWGMYLAGSTPLGAIACSPSCAAIAVDRMKETGRVDDRNAEH